jgi:hypothetical protein
LNNIVEIKPVEIGENYRFDHDQMLEAAKGLGFSRLVIIADYEKSDGIYLAGSANAGETFILMELAKREILDD